MDILFCDDEVIVCVKPAGLLSETGENSLPKLLEARTGGRVYAVHRLDAGVGGVMVYAANGRAAAALSAQIRDGGFVKTYLAVVRGTPSAQSGTYTDLLFHDSRRNKSFVVDRERKGVKRAALDYRIAESAVTPAGELSLAEVRLHTGRTHQIRVQFASRGTPLYGDGKYGGRTEKSGIALFSHSIGFDHPKTGERLSFTAEVPHVEPWTFFATQTVEKGTERGKI